MIKKEERTAILSSYASETIVKKKAALSGPFNSAEDKR